MMMVFKILEINNPSFLVVNRMLDTMDVEQTRDYNPSMVVFEHVQNFDGVI